MNGPDKGLVYGAAICWGFVALGTTAVALGESGGINAVIGAGVPAVAFTIGIAVERRATRSRFTHAIARCSVEQCTTTGTLANPGGDWSRDGQGHHFCPAHPAATSCRICGRDKGGNRIICGPCARGESKENEA